MRHGIEDVRIRSCISGLSGEHGIAAARSIVTPLANHNASKGE